MKRNRILYIIEHHIEKMVYCDYTYMNIY